MSKQWLVRCLVVLAACVVMAGSVVAQKQNNDPTGTLDAIRADMRADRQDIVKNAMNLTPAEGDKFWPVYRQYQFDLASLNDKRIALLKQYAENYKNMSDKEAKDLAEKTFDAENDRIDLRRDYFDRFRKATSSVIAARFFQIEHRLDLVSDVQIANAVPGLYEKTPASAEK